MTEQPGIYDQKTVTVPEDRYDPFAAARLADSMRVVQERHTIFQVAGHEHTAYQDLGDGGWIEETITIRWRVKPLVNGTPVRAAQTES